jgi:hypothetical protein
MRAAPERRTPYVWLPRTSFTIGRLFGQRRDARRGPEGDRNGD